MDKQKQIEEIADTTLDCVYSFGTCPNPKIGCLKCRTKALVEQGYRNVVTCKDCIHRWTTNCALYYATWGEGNGSRVVFGGACYKDDFYCAYGVKKPE